jgi:hypothetical protein
VPGGLPGQDARTVWQQQPSGQHLAGQDLSLNGGDTQQGFRVALIKCGLGSSIFSKLRIEGFDNKKVKKLTTENVLIPGFHKGRLIYGRSLQPSKENIQHFKT